MQLRGHGYFFQTSDFLSGLRLLPEKLPQTSSCGNSSQWQRRKTSSWTGLHVGRAKSVLRDRWRATYGLRITAHEQESCREKAEGMIHTQCWQPTTSALRAAMRTWRVWRRAMFLWNIARYCPGVDSFSRDYVLDRSVRANSGTDLESKNRNRQLIFWKSHWGNVLYKK